MKYLIIDGYNVIRQTKKYQDKELLSLAEGREALLFDIEEYCAKTGYTGIIVFDASDRDNVINSSEMFGCLDVVYSSKDQSADDVIKKLVKEHKSWSSEVIVVTADMAVRGAVLMDGGYTVDPQKFIDLLRRAKPLGG